MRHYSCRIIPETDHMSIAPCPSHTTDAPLPLRQPPQVIVVGCDDESGPGIFGSAHMRGEWVARYLSLDGDIVKEIRSLLGAIGVAHLEPATAARVAKAISELEAARNPCSGR
jgi:hypothetical protein